MDSYALDLSQYKIESPVRIVSKLSAPIQSELSSNCGLFCLWFIDQRSKRKSFKSAIKVFGRNLEANDKIVETFVKKLHIKNIKKAGQICCSQKVNNLLAK